MLVRAHSNQDKDEKGIGAVHDFGHKEGNTTHALIKPTRNYEKFVQSSLTLCLHWNGGRNITTRTQPHTTTTTIAICRHDYRTSHSQLGKIAIELFVVPKCNISYI